MSDDAKEYVFDKWFGLRDDIEINTSERCVCCRYRYKADHTRIPDMPTFDLEWWSKVPISNNGEYLNALRVILGIKPKIYFRGRERSAKNIIALSNALIKDRCQALMNAEKGLIIMREVEL